MRSLLAMFSLILLSCSAATAQDPGMQAAQAAQQATQQAIQANQQAMEANRQANEAARQAMQNALNTSTDPCCFHVTAQPKFSVRPGTYSSPTTVKITDTSRGAVIFYTTDGWTPTLNSTRYRGPILIGSTTVLQAIAISPSGARSLVTSAQYVIFGSSPSSSDSGTAAAPPNTTLVHLAFAVEVSSRTSEIGEKIPMVLTEDLQLTNTVVKKGASATATVTAVDRTGAAGAPGVISFEVDFLQSDGGPLALRGGATKEGSAKSPNAAVLIPVVGPLALLKHGTDAVIAKGTPFTAFLKTETQ